MSLLVISPCYFPDTTPADLMVETARRNGIEPLLYGVGGVMEPHCGNIQGTDVIQLLEGRTEQYVMAVDCLDVAILDTAEEILRRFSKLNSGMLYCAERECWPYCEETWKRLDSYDGYHKALNAGAWIGDRAYALHCIKEAIRLYRHNPAPGAADVDGMQPWMTNLFVYGGIAKIDIDRNCHIFQSMNLNVPANQVIRFDAGQVTNMTTGTSPAVLHFNGDKSRGYYMEVCEQLRNQS